MSIGEKGEMMHVLLLEGHTVEALPVLKSLKNGGCRITTICDSRWSYGYQSRYPDCRIVRRLHYDRPETREYLLTMIMKQNFDVVIPLYDPSARFVSENKTLISKHTHVTIPDPDVFARGFEKNRLMRLCRENGIPHPKTYDLDGGADAAVKAVGFPALIKPNISSGGRGMVLVRDDTDVRKVLPTILNEFGGCTLQEYIPFGGRQYKVQLFRTRAGKICQATIMEKYRFYPEKGGSSCCSQTIEGPELVAVTSRVLDILGWEGFADFDLIEDPRDGTVKIMEINPRFPACIKAAFVSGVDFAEIYVDYCLGRELKRYVYKPGRVLRYFGLDVLWLLHSRERFRTKPSWFRLFGKDIYYQDGSRDDPLPFIFGQLGKVRLMADSRFRRSKAGLRA